MALSRKMLKAMGIEDEKIDQIIEAHVETTDNLKADRDKYKEEAEKISEVQRELEAVKKERDELQLKVDADDSYKAKYESEHAAYEEFKNGVAVEKENARKADAYKALLKKAGISDKRHDAILKLNKYKDLVFDDKGEVVDADKVVDGLKDEWSEFVVTTRTEGAKTENPPANTGGKMTIEQIDAIEDTAERQKAMLENHELYGI